MYIYVLRPDSSEMFPYGKKKKKGENVAKTLPTQYIRAFLRHVPSLASALRVVTGWWSRDHRLVLSAGCEKGEDSTR